KPATNSATTDEDSGEFACFDTFDALAAYCHHKYGEAFLRQVFGKMLNDPPDQAYPGGGPREDLADCAAELEKRGLDKPAAVLRDLAHQAVSGIDLPPDYWLRYPGMWEQKWLQEREIKLGTFFPKLRREYAKRERLAWINAQIAAKQRH